MSRTRTIDVHVDWFVVILRLQVEQLGHHQARVLICHLSIKFIIIDNNIRHHQYGRNISSEG